MEAPRSDPPAETSHIVLCFQMFICSKLRVCTLMPSASCCGAWGTKPLLIHLGCRSCTVDVASRGATCFEARSKPGSAARTSARCRSTTSAPSSASSITGQSAPRRPYPAAVHALQPASRKAANCLNGRRREVPGALPVAAEGEDGRRTHLVDLSISRSKHWRQCGEIVLNGQGKRASKPWDRNGKKIGYQASALSSCSGLHLACVPCPDWLGPVLQNIDAVSIDRNLLGKRSTRDTNSTAIQ